MTHATWNRGLIVVWTTMLGMTGIGGISLAVLGPPKPMREADNRTSPPRMAEPSKQPVNRFPAANTSLQANPSVQAVNLPGNSMAQKPPALVPADDLPMAAPWKAAMAPAASGPAIGRTLFGIASIAVDEAAKSEAVVTAPVPAAPAGDLAPNPQAENPPADQRPVPFATPAPVLASAPPSPPIAETPPSNLPDATPTSRIAEGNELQHSPAIRVPPTPPAPLFMDETRPASPAAASPQSFKFRIRASADSAHEARARELTSKVQSSFNQITEWQSETEVPAVAVICYPAAVDHATAMDVGRLVGSLGYAWHVEKLPAQFTDATIDIWLPDGSHAPLHQTASKLDRLASQVPANKLIWSPSELTASPPNRIASGSSSNVLQARPPPVPPSGSDVVSAKVSANHPQPSATAYPGDLY